MRAASEGVEVAVGAPLLLVHCATQKPLCVEAAKVPTDYGIELEVGRAGARATGTGTLRLLAPVRLRAPDFRGL